MRAIAAVSVALLVLCSGGVLLLRRGRAGAVRAGTWDCGYAVSGSPRVQYTGSSFAQYLLRQLGWAVAQRTTRPPPPDLFPQKSHFAQEPQETLLHRVLMPFCQRWAERCARLRVLQHGNVQVYLGYMLAVLLLLLGWSVLESWLRT
jgi:hydrogenase-4 component B